MEEQNIFSNLYNRISDVLGDNASNTYSFMEIGPTMQFIVLFIAILLFVGIITRLLLGRRSEFNRAMSCALGILVVYIITIIIYTFQPWTLSNILSPLPFVVLSGNRLIILPYIGTGFTRYCSQIVSLIILAFLVNLSDGCTPVGRTWYGWLISRVFMVSLCMVLHFFISWGLNTYFPGFIVVYAPVLILIILLAFFLIGISKVLLGIVLTAINPFVGAVYAFFFSNHIGRQLSKAIFSTMLLCTLFFLVQHYGYTSFSIEPSALMSYSPIVAVLLVLWYLLGHEL